VIEIWQDESQPLGAIASDFSASPHQDAAWKSSAALYGTHYFRPVISLPAPPGQIKDIKLCYPTLLIAASSGCYIWDVRSANFLRELRAQDIDDHIMQFDGLDASRDVVVAFDPQQVQFFSQKDGLILRVLSDSILSEDGMPRGVQLLPPWEGITPSQCSRAVLLHQTLFRKRRRWLGSRGLFSHSKSSLFQ
jgi:hypothetical protein